MLSSSRRRPGPIGRLGAISKIARAGEWLPACAGMTIVELINSLTLDALSPQPDFAGDGAVPKRLVNKGTQSREEHRRKSSYGGVAPRTPADLPSCRNGAALEFVSIPMIGAGELNALSL